MTLTDFGVCFKFNSGVGDSEVKYTSHKGRDVELIQMYRIYSLFYSSSQHVARTAESFLENVIKIAAYSFHEGNDCPAKYTFNKCLQIVAKVHTGDCSCRST